MKKYSNHLWLFPLCFLIFFSLYLLVKFFFIFFLGAAYEPAFIFHLTPMYLLSGLSNVQLLSISLVVMVLDLSLHLRMSKQQLLLSFLPTSLMIAGVGYTIMFSSLELSYILHYLVFGCLILVILIDHQHILKGVEPLATQPKNASMMMKMIHKEPAANSTKSLFLRNAGIAKQQLTPVVADSIVELKRVSDTILHNTQIILDDLDKKTLQIQQLENKFEKQKNISYDPRPYPKHDISAVQRKEKDLSYQKNVIRTLSDEEQMVLREKIQNHLVIDKSNEIVAIVKRGVFKEVSNSFVGFLGYERTELLQKNFFVFIAPRGFDEAQRYFLNRLKGVAPNSFRTFLCAKDQTELLVEITVTPTVYKGYSAEFLCVKEIKNNS